MMFLSLEGALKNEEFCNKLDQGDFEWIYANLGLTAIPMFSTMLLDEGVNPLDGMNHVPVFFVRGARIESIELRDGLTHIDAQAFACCKNLKEVIIPEGAVTIEHHAFLSCHSLEAVFIPKSVTYIGDQAFYGCSKLKIYYEGPPGSIDTSYNWKEYETEVLYNCTREDFEERR